MLTLMQNLIPCVSRRHFNIKIAQLKLRKFTTKDDIPFFNIVNMSTTIKLYKSVQSVLEDFGKNENKDVSGVNELLAIYANALDRQKKSYASGEVKKHPLIVLEGLDGSGKTTMGKKLAKKLNARQWCTPPESISHLRSLFDDSTVLRTAFYSLGNYIAALEVQLILKDQPVVMDRYWHSTAAYAIAQAVQDDPSRYKMPESGNEIYRWPEDLFKPDVVVLLEVSEAVRLERHSRRNTATTQERLLQSSNQFRQNVLQAYKNMYNPGIKIVNGDYSFGATLGQLQRAVRPFFV